MELCRDIFANFLSEYYIETVVPLLEEKLKEIAEMKCCRALQKIKAVVENDSLDDPECFMKIEEIVRALEEIGSNGGNRHDFG